jgi:hypothetical protein
MGRDSIVLWHCVCGCAAHTLGGAWGGVGRLRVRWHPRRRQRPFRHLRASTARSHRSDLQRQQCSSGYPYLGADRTPARIPARLPGDEPARGASPPAPARGGFWAGTMMLMRAARRAPSLIHEGHKGPRSADNPPLPFRGGLNTRAHPSTPTGGRTRARGASPPAPRVGGSGRVQRCSCVLPAARLLSSTKDTKVHEAPTIPRCPLGADRTPARAAQAPLPRAWGVLGGYNDAHACCPPRAFSHPRRTRRSTKRRQSPAAL